MINLTNVQRDLIAATLEIEWTRRADNVHSDLRHTSHEYRKLEVEFFVGAMGTLQLLAPDDSPQAYIPSHWMVNPVQGRTIIEPYRIRRLSRASLTERAAKMIQGVVPADKFGKDLATAFIKDPDDSNEFHDWVKALRVGL